MTCLFNNSTGSDRWTTSDDDATIIHTLFLLSLALTYQQYLLLLRILVFSFEYVDINGGIEGNAPVWDSGFV